MILFKKTLQDQSKKFFPYGVLLLICINTVFFFTVQIDNQQYKEKAINYYFQNDLDKIEFPLFVRFLQTKMADENCFQKLENIFFGNTTKGEMYWMQRLDPLFQQCLGSKKCFPATSLYYMRWEEKRREYLKLIEKDATQRFGFESAQPSIMSLFTQTFVYSDPLEFVVNIFFLIALGVMIEAQIGLVGIVGCYLLFGTLMLSVYELLMPFSLVPLLGSYGAIAGLNGLFFGLYGFSKAGCYYLAPDGVRHNYISTSLFVLLWLLCQVIFLRFFTLNFIDLISEMMSFICGIIFAILIRRIQNVSNKTILQKDIFSDFKVRLNEALEETSMTNYDKARKILTDLLNEYPNNHQVHYQLYNIAKLNPGSDEYHNIVQEIFSLRDHSKATIAMVNLVFNNYIRRALPTFRFDVGLFLNLLQRFRKAGYYEDAEKILAMLIKHNQNGRMSEMLAREHLLLARSYLSKNDKVQGGRLLKFLIDNFPQTESAKQVKTSIHQRHSNFL